MKNIYIQNASRPRGLMGHDLLKRMNGGHHEALSLWGLSRISPDVSSDCLDAGCGGGANIIRLLSLCPEGHVTGIDYSSASVQHSMKFCRKEIKAGKCDVMRADVTGLPFEKDSFDLVTAFETVYFWPDIHKIFINIYNVIRPGGTFFICNETDGNKDSDALQLQQINGMKIYTAEQLSQLLSDTGFQHIDVFTEPENHWLALAAKK